MARHRWRDRPKAAELDRRPSRLPDGDVVPVAGHDRWTDLINAAVDGPTMELPLLRRHWPALVRPYVRRPGWLR